MLMIPLRKLGDCWVDAGFVLVRLIRTMVIETIKMLPSEKVAYLFVGFIVF